MPSFTRALANIFKRPAPKAVVLEDADYLPLHIHIQRHTDELRAALAAHKSKQTKEQHV